MKNKPRSLIILFLAILLIGCNNQKFEFKLYVSVSNWSGWDSYYESPIEEYAFDLNKDNKITIDTNMGTYIFKIKRINSKEITIKSNEALALNTNDGVNLDSNQKDFNLEYENPIKLTTLTMDAGVNFKFEYK